MSFEVIKCNIDGLLEIRPVIHEDSRGYFFEQFNESKYPETGIVNNFVQDNISVSKKYVLRGMHFQKKYPQGKLITVLKGVIYDVAVDLRLESSTYLKYHGLILDSKIHNQFYIPEYFAHGFLVLSDSAMISYKCTDFYHPEDEAGFMWNDPKLAINWADYLENQLPVLSEKDTKYAPLK